MSNLLSTLSFLLVEHLLLRNEQEKSLLSTLDKLIAENLLLNGDIQQIKSPQSFMLLHKEVFM